MKKILGSLYWMNAIIKTVMEILKLEDIFLKTILLHLYIFDYSFLGQRSSVDRGDVVWLLLKELKG